MNVSITGRHVDVGQDLKEYITAKVNGLSKYSSKLDSVLVTFEEGKMDKMVDVTVHMGRDVIEVKERAADMKSAFDIAFDIAKQQVLKKRDRVKRQRRRVAAGQIRRSFKDLLSAGENRIEETGEPVVLRRPEKFASKPMSVEEAALELFALDEEFIMFKNAQTGAVNVIYRIKRNRCGLIEPQF